VLRVRLPLHVADDSVPEPGLALVAQPTRADRHPTTAVLVVEVACSSRAVDRGRKAELYAAAGIPTYWLVDLDLRAVELRVDPAPAGCWTLRTLAPGELLPSPCASVEPFAVDVLVGGL
jgi:Uma2 family endonuclease